MGSSNTRERDRKMTNQEHPPDEAFIGKELGSRPFEVSVDHVEDYFEGLKLDSEWYEDDSEGRDSLLPSMILIDAESMIGASFRNNFGNLWMRQELDFHAPLSTETEMRVESRVKDIYEWRNRTIVLQESKIYGENDTTLGVMRHHQSYLLDQDSGRVALRKPSDKEGVRKFNVPKGDLLEPVTREIDLEMCGTFFHGNKHYHTNKEASQELGFEEVVVGGKMTISYIGDMLDRSFGHKWFDGGKLDVKFTNIVWPGDRVTARGVLTDERSVGDDIAEARVWMEKDDGTVVIVGNAYIPD